MIEQVYVPHPDDIRLHLQSGFNLSFVKKAEITYSMQMLQAGNCMHLIRGEFPLEIRTMVFAIKLKLAFKTYNEVKVVAGIYLGIQGHIISKMGDMYDICQHTTNKLVQVSQYYLDHCPLQYSLQGQFLPSQSVKPLPEHELIEIGDFIEVLVGQDFGKSGTVEWVSPGGVIVWFRHTISPEDNFRPLLIGALTSSVHHIRLPTTLKFTKEKGYDVRPGDSVSIVCGPKYMTTGVVQHVDLAKARLLLLSESDQSMFPLASQ
ncbi:hypothetical protein EV702DRAFT_1196677 [Suillus placidus]|uniref:KOW domain-containing protein n=1 Tax=Suillus placidus TaxID=48579 RepID=A0A9P6ZW47_9AGAM|nr:hypothetical protein EV702DRAFT_1196677 [Suillus placidus]